MEIIITVKVPDTEANKARLVDLLSIPGVVIEVATAAGYPIEDVVPKVRKAVGKKRSSEKGTIKANGDEWLTLAQMAKMVGKGYYTVRKWVVEQEVIPSLRPGGDRGSIIVQRKDVVGLMGGN